MMQYIKLNNDVKMPILGLGVYQLTKDNNCEEIILKALQNGYRLIDTASYYNNEIEVGNAIKKSGINRQEIFLTTKVWCDSISYEGVMTSFEQSCKRLQTDYIDLFLLHWPVGDIFGAWKALEELYLQKKVRAIGVSNFLNDHLMNLIAFNKIKPAINQIEVNVFYQRDQEFAFNQEMNVQIEAWSPLARGRNQVFENPVLTKIAQKYQKSIPQIIIRWLIQRNIIVIAKSSSEQRLIENINVFDFQLSDKEMKQIKQLNLNKSCFFDQRDPAIIKKFTNYQN